jgi:hypothetical protein
LAWPGEIDIYSKLATRREHIKKKQPDQTHQEGRNYARLPSHDASWTGYYTRSAAEYAAQQHSAPQLHLHQLLQFIVDFLHSQPQIQRCIIARGRLDASSLPSSPAFRLQLAPLGKPSNVRNQSRQLSRNPYNIQLYD